MFPLAGEFGIPLVPYSVEPTEWSAKRRYSRAEVSAGRRSGRCGLGRRSRCRRGHATALTHSHAHCAMDDGVVVTWVAGEAPCAARELVHDGVGGDSCRGSGVELEK